MVIAAWCYTVVKELVDKSVLQNSKKVWIQSLEWENLTGGKLQWGRLGDRSSPVSSVLIAYREKMTEKQFQQIKKQMMPPITRRIECTPCESNRMIFKGSKEIKTTFFW